MGSNKALLEVDGVAMGRRVAVALRDAGCADVVACGGDPTTLAPLGLQVVPEPWPGTGPLSGVLGALDWAAAAAPLVLVAACDLPWLTPAQLAPLVDVARRCPDADVVVATTGRVEPACAVWRASIEAQVAAMHAQGQRALQSVIGDLRSVEVPVDPSALRNINTPYDLDG